MLVAEDAAMIVGLGIIGIIIELTDNRSAELYADNNNASFYWMGFVILHACRVVLQRRLESADDFSLPPWTVKLGRLEFFTDGICKSTK